MVLIAVTGSIGGLLFGYDTGIIAAALGPISEQFHLGTTMEQVVASSILVGCAIGALSAGHLTDRLGRRPVVSVIALLFAVAALLCATTHASWTLILFRLLLGLAVGGASQAIPVYVSELAPEAKRGGLVVTFQLAVVVGLLISGISGIALAGNGDSWRWMIALGAIPAVVLALGMLALPESPRFLHRRGRVTEARAVLARVRDADADLDGEIESIRQIEELDRNQAGLSELFTSRMRPALTAGLGIAILCQITGVNAIIYYAPTILSKAGFQGTGGLWASLMNSVAIVVLTVIGMRLVDTWGRRAVMLRFIPISIVGVIILALSFSGSTSKAPWLTVVGMVVFIAFNAGSLSVCVWLVISEIFPLRVRGRAAAVGAAGVWIADLLVSLTTLSLVQALGATGTFLLFTAVSAVAMAFVYFFIPETKGRSLEDIERSLDDGTFAPVRRGQAASVRA